MIKMSEQLSAARQSQLEAQLQFFNSFTSKAVASAEKLVALNLNLARETVEKSSTAMCQVMTARDAADLFALGAGAPDTISRLMAYGRELMSIAAGGALAQPATPQQAVARVAPAPAPAPAQSQATAPTSAPTAVPEPAQSSDIDTEGPAATTPMARALDSVGVKSGAARPAAASFPPADEVNVHITGIEPVEASPPPAPSAGTPEIAQEAPAAKGRKKK